MKRTHDSFYAHEASRGSVKEIFRLIADRIDALPECSGRLIGDIGCATGDLPFYLSERFPSDTVVGLEYLDELLSKARETYPELEFKKADITNRNDLRENSYDIITVSGVISIFDDVQPILENLYAWVKPGGKVLVLGMFNPYDFDVFIKYKASGLPLNDSLESGWNIVSQETVRQILFETGAVDVAFHRFISPIDFPQRDDDHVRSWTEKDLDGRRYIINGLNIKQPFYLLEFSKGTSLI